MERGEKQKRFASRSHVKIQARTWSCSGVSKADEKWDRTIVSTIHSVGNNVTTIAVTCMLLFH